MDAPSGPSPVCCPSTWEQVDAAVSTFVGCFGRLWLVPWENWSSGPIIGGESRRVPGCNQLLRRPHPPLLWRGGAIERIQEQLMTGTHKFQNIRRIKIPKKPGSTDLTGAWLSLARGWRVHANASFVSPMHLWAQVPMGIANGCGSMLSGSVRSLRLSALRCSTC
jgi:hypothetical protein